MHCSALLRLENMRFSKQSRFSDNKREHPESIQLILIFSYERWSSDSRDEVSWLGTSPSLILLIVAMPPISSPVFNTG